MAARIDSIVISELAATDPPSITYTMAEEKKRPPRHPKRLFRRSKCAPAVSDLSLDSQRSSSFASSRPAIAAAADDGRPSSSALRDLKRVVQMIKDERHLLARDLYVDARRRILDGSAPSRQANRVDDSKQNHKPPRWKITAAASARDNFAAVKGKDSENKSYEEEDENNAAREFLNEKKEEFIALEVRLVLFLF